MTWQQAEQALLAARPDGWQFVMHRATRWSGGELTRVFSIAIEAPDTAGDDVDVVNGDLQGAVNAVLDRWANWKLRESETAIG